MKMAFLYRDFVLEQSMENSSDLAPEKQSKSKKIMKRKDVRL